MYTVLIETHLQGWIYRCKNEYQQNIINMMFLFCHCKDVLLQKMFQNLDPKQTSMKLREILSQRSEERARTKLLENLV